MKKLVRDNIHKLDQSGQYKYCSAAYKEIPQLLADKLREEVEEFLAKPCLDEYVDVTDIFAQVAVYHNVISDDQQWKMITAYHKMKNDRNGGFRDYWVRESLKPEVVGPPVLLQRAVPSPEDQTPVQEPEASQNDSYPEFDVQRVPLPNEDKPLTVLEDFKAIDTLLKETGDKP